MTANSDQIKEITHRNVERLVDAIRAEREAREAWGDRITALERTVQQLVIRMQEAEQKANVAMAVAQQGRL